MSDRHPSLCPQDLLQHVLGLAERALPIPFLCKHPAILPVDVLQQLSLLLLHSKPTSSGYSSSAGLREHANSSRPAPDRGPAHD